MEVTIFFRLYYRSHAEAQRKLRLCVSYSMNSRFRKLTRTWPRSAAALTLVIQNHAQQPGAHGRDFGVALRHGHCHRAAAAR
jgi:hypothetical protein